MFKRYEFNATGKDYAVGDIHGCFSALQSELDRIKFDESKDRLFSVGDLVDRGPESDQALDWIEKPWFHPVRGNHDDYVVRHKTCDIDNWIYNGGIWFQSLFDCEKQEFADAFSMLPHAIEVDTKFGAIGIVHADPVVKDWSDIESFCNLRRQAERVMWSRDRWEKRDSSGVSGISFVIVGHTPAQDLTALGNVIHIDTAGWHRSGRFTILDINTMQPV